MAVLVSGNNSHVTAETIEFQGNVDVAQTTRYDGIARVTVNAAAGGQNITYASRSSNTILAAADLGGAVHASAAFTQTLTAAATLGSGWWCILKNATTDGTSILTVDPNSTELIDGVTTIKMYSGDTRLLLCTGTAFVTSMLQGGFAKFAVTGPWIVPTGASWFTFDLIGAGGNGAAGAGAAAGNARQGGSAGGGGGHNSFTVAAQSGASDFTANSSITVSVGSGGHAASVSQINIPGNNAIQAYPGGDGAAGATGGSDSSGGGGGSAGEYGENGNATFALGGGQVSADLTLGFSGNGTGHQGGCSLVGGIGRGADWGGGAGGGAKGAGSSTGQIGGNSVRGPGGGGGGGGLTTGNTQVSGGRAGISAFWTASGASGPTGGTATNPGTAGWDSTSNLSGSGGGGGGSNASGTGGAGGVGGIPGGGGGGGGAGTTGGAGGLGARGEVRIWYG